jgi:Kef-type K+ transport system membrane component KefB
MKYLGYSLVLLGCLGLILLYLMHLAFVNSLLIASLLIIITGVVVQVWKEKRESNY